MLTNDAFVFVSVGVFVFVFASVFLILFTLKKMQINVQLFIPDNCHFWYATIFFRPVKGTPKKCVNSRQKLSRVKTA